MRTVLTTGTVRLPTAEVVTISDPSTTDATYRMTPQREAVLHAVRSSGRHPTADDIHRAVTTGAPGIGVATVYRTLDLLVRHGVIRELRLGDEAVSRYDGNTHRHDHVICSSCGQVADVEVALPHEVIASAAEQAEVAVDHYDLQFHGTCERCRR